MRVLNRALLLLLMQISIVSVKASSDTEISTKQDVLKPTHQGRWVGLGIAYSPYRDGESPLKGSVPSKQNILEDLQLLALNQHISWHLIRLYAADEASTRVLEVIKEHKLPIKVMLGAWLSGRQSSTENENQITNLITLAQRFPELVIAVNLGNEVFVEWSHHRLSRDDIPQYLSWLKQVQAKLKVPVTLADDYNFWNKPWSKPVAEQVDFIVLHAYAMWNSQTLGQAVGWTQNTYRAIQALHPNKQIVLGESGWATSSVSSNGDERLIIAEASEQAQATFFYQYREWLQRERIVSFYFQAFDEQWKGGEDKPDAIAEKNWGIFRSDRTPKLVIQQIDRNSQ